MGKTIFLLAGIVQSFFKLLGGNLVLQMQMCSVCVHAFAHVWRSEKEGRRTCKTTCDYWSICWPQMNITLLNKLTSLFGILEIYMNSCLVPLIHIFSLFAFIPYMCVCVCVYFYVFVYVCVCFYVFVYMCVCLNVCVCMRVLFALQSRCPVLITSLTLFNSISLLFLHTWAV